ncbi:hypothetical protein [Chamaesiphon polymorphus]|uniref:Uncharacterized protein n=1 Tax=Chamaesiphon polymorphus CCALA 037 TaxID=2107692 RepID=A0A2T1FR51_9CYAN|nr:hypothetical protein [Chamaesiphon polymorphus]PSB47462.1 hypothetical protein C7B77_24310 [Chamaesiphon polymorphus CCALA 037]
MNTAISNLIILTADVNGDKIVGTAIDGDIKVLFAIPTTELSQRLFVPEANLIVSGKFRLGRDAGTIGISIASVIAVIYLPVAAPAAEITPTEVAASVEQIAPSDTPAKSKRKTSNTRSKKAAKTPVAA